MPGRTSWSTRRWTLSSDDRIWLPVATLAIVNDPLTELSARLEEAAEQLRSPDVEVDAALALIEECARLAGEASSQVDERTRAALEPLPDLPGQLPLPAS